MVVLLEGTTDSAVLMPSHNDILDFEHLNLIMDSCEQVDIRGEEPGWQSSCALRARRLKPHYLIDGHSRIGTADPEVLGCLIMGKTLEEFVVAIDHGLRPFLLFCMTFYKSSMMVTSHLLYVG